MSTSCFSNELETIPVSYPPSIETAFSCSSGGRGAYIQAWNIANGAVLRTYAGDASGEASCLCMAGEEYLLCALKLKPFIFVWRTDRQQIHHRIACTGLVTALECDQNAVYCIGAIVDKINIWEISTGHLLGQVARHYQPVSTLHFVSSGHHFLSGGNDGMVITWDLASVLSKERLTHCKDPPHFPKPLKESRFCSEMTPVSFHVWSDHSMMVTGIASSSSSREDRERRVFTCSLDLSCKMYEFKSGVLLGTFLFPSPLSSLAVSSDNLWLFTGSTSGQIIATPLFLPSLKQVVDTSNSSNKFMFTFDHHKKAVTSIKLSLNNTLLLSACEDGLCIVWDITSKQILRTVKHNGPVTDMVLLHRSKPMFNPSSSSTRSSTLKKYFGKQLSYTRGEMGTFEHEVPVRTGDINLLSDNAIESLNEFCGDSIVSEFVFQPEYKLSLSEQDICRKEEDSANNNVMRKEMKELRDVHKKLYSFAMDRLLS